MRRAARVDANQPAIVAALRAVGATVQPLSSVGEGCPDILVGFRRHNILIEIKDGEKAPSDRELTDPQIKWHIEWRGQAAVVTCVEQALAVLGSVSEMPASAGVYAYRPKDAT